ncbi:MAG: hypothetical protein AB7K09_11615 [Planctomycetota bacterium]
MPEAQLETRLILIGATPVVVAELDKDVGGRPAIWIDRRLRREVKPPLVQGDRDLVEWLIRHEPRMWRVAHVRLADGTRLVVHRATRIADERLRQFAAVLSSPDCEPTNSRSQRPADE